MKYKEATDILTSPEKLKIDLSLTRVKKMAKILENPQENLTVIHVAGTNGKGSTAAMLAQIFKENGFKTGLYTSPHIKNYTERIRINGRSISQKDFTEYLAQVETVAGIHHIELTEFEVLTLMAFLYFNDKKTDIVILETGMGGRLDATNIVKKPLLTIITSISSDHTDRLGNSIEQIAREKAGILKRNVPVVISPDNSGFETVKQAADFLKCRILTADKKFELKDANKNIFSDGEEFYKLSLRGLHQAKNLALVIRACEYFYKTGYNLEVKKALWKVNWHSRFEYIKEQNLIVDAAHNPDAAAILKQNLDKYFKDRKRIFLFGILSTKDYENYIKNLFTSEDEIYLVDDFAANAVKKEQLKATIEKHFPYIKVYNSTTKKLMEFLVFDSKDTIKVVTGSFYLCSKVF